MIGVIVNVLAVALGGVLGTVFSKKLSTRFTTELNKVFGVCAIGMGISSVPLMENMPAVILAVVASRSMRARSRTSARRSALRVIWASGSAAAAN